MMNSNTRFSLFLLFVASATASPIGEERLAVFNTNGGLSIGLNATNLIYGLTVIGGLVLIVALLGLLITPLRRSSPAYQFESEPYGAQYEDVHYRKKRYAVVTSDMATQMVQLAEAFKKYEVEEQCQSYVSCSARVAREDQALLRIVDNIMGSMLKSGHENIRQKDEYVGQLLDAYLEGESKDCRKYRARCYKRKFH